QDIDNGSYDNCSLTLSLDKLTFDCSNVGDNTVALTGVDASGNAATATATVTVVDNIAPSVQVQNLDLTLNASGNATITVSEVEVSSSDNCGIDTKVLSKTSFNCDDLGDNDVTLTVTDINGNATTETFNVSITDTTAPTVIAQDYTVSLDANGNASISVEDIDNGSYDNCSLTLSLDKLTFDCSNVGDNTVTLSGVDASGNSATATATVTVVDDSAPEVTINSITASLDENGQATITATDLVDNAISVCEVEAFEGGNNHAVWLSKYTASNSNVNFQFDNNGGELVQFPDGTATVRGRIVNPNDANDAWSVVLNLTDRKDWNQWSALGRSWKGNANKVQDNYKDWSYYLMDTANPSQLVGEGSNAGQTISITHMPANYRYGFQVGQAANDKNRNFGMSGWFFYTNRQGKSVQGDFNLDISTCRTTTGLSACDPYDITVSQSEFDCSNIGQNTVTVTVADIHGNTNTQTTTVTIVDEVAPTVIAQDYTVSLDANGNASISVQDIDNGSYDNCSLTLSLDKLTFDCSNIGDNTVTLSGVDASGNSASATATVTVVDDIAPSAIGQDITVSLNQNGQASITAEQINNGSTDNCGTPQVEIDINSFDCSNIGDNIVTLTATDGSGNTSTTTVTVTVVDNIAPVIITKNTTITLDANGNASISVQDIDNGSYDNCSLTLSLDKLTFDCSNVGENTVTLSGVDASGNSATATATVTVVDDIAPSVQVQNLNLTLDASGNATITVSEVEVSSSDNCGIDTKVLSKTSFDCSNLGDNQVTLTVTDSNGNVTTESFSIFISDHTAPTVIAQDYTVSLDANGNASISVQDIDNGSYDNCSLTLSLDKLTFDCSNIGENTVTLSGADASGNSATATATVTVVDNIAPSAIGQDITVSLNQNGQASITAEQINNGSTDNCGIPEVEIDINSFDCSNIGDNIVTLTATDGSGNTSTTTVTVTVVDNITPVISDVPEDIMYQITDNNCSASITWNAPTSIDNCEVTLTSSHQSGATFPVGTTQVTYTATDAAGNQTTSTFDVTVIASPVTITLEAFVYNQTEGYNISCNGASDGEITAVVEGGCGALTYEWNVSASGLSLYNVSAGTYTLTVTDETGVSTSESITLTEPSPLNIESAITPEYPGGDGSEEHTIYLGYGEQTVTLSANATGGAGDYSYSWTPEEEIACSSFNSVVVAPQITTTYEVLVTDAAGCSTSKTFTVYVIDVRCEDTPGGGNNDGGDNGNGNDAPCQCEGKMKNFSVVYNGFSGATVKAYRKNKSDKIESYYNVQNGDILKVEGFDHKGRLDSKTYLKIGNAYYKVHTSCSEDILGKTIGPFTVIEYTDGEGSTCSVDDSNDDGNPSHGDDDDDDRGDDNDDDDDDDDDHNHDDDDNGQSDDDDDDKGRNHDDDDDDKHKSDDDDDDKNKSDSDDDDDKKKNKHNSSNEIKGYGSNYGSRYLYSSNHYGGNDDDDDDNSSGSNNTGNNDCQCEGRMENFTVIYNGQSGATIKAYNKKMNKKIAEFSNVQNGDQLIITGFDKHDRLESKTFLKINGFAYEIHTSCSINILGQSYGPFKVIAYTDGEGSSCSLITSDPSTPAEESSCTAVEADGGGHAMWLDDYTYNGYSAKFNFDNNSGKLSYNSDGSITLTGMLKNVQNMNDKWEISFRLEGGHSWTEWSGLGRGYKDEKNLAGDKYEDWTYYTLNSDSKLKGKGSNHGKVVSVYHMPTNYFYGFQLGEAANNKNSNYGLSGWFYYKNYCGQWEKADINIDLEDCNSNPPGEPNDCIIDTVEWNGNITVCYNGVELCVSQQEAESLIASGATLGSCSVTTTSNSLTNGEASTQELESTTDNDELKIHVSAYPNPTRDFTNITFEVKEAGPVKVGIYTSQGVRVGDLFEDVAEANKTYSIEFDGSSLLDGIYLIRVNTADVVKTKKLMIKR
ncbi:MAG: HYR domain-containing protein, partial [Roseivirga sp.]|nr:HYR domain-containing protein [Roseivirga sp.]